mmetsp:Transcript_58811/g.124720  ORF Transcript_58811/g.124720 Transcript_58811/m.124720 type:complete len:550 (+) Transcript_58811:88-1737(+)
MWNVLKNFGGVDRKRKSGQEHDEARERFAPRRRLEFEHDLPAKLPVEGTRGKLTLSKPGLAEDTSARTCTGQPVPTYQQDLVHRSDKRSFAAPPPLPQWILEALQVPPPRALPVNGLSAGVIDLDAEPINCDDETLPNTGGLHDDDGHMRSHIQFTGCDTTEESVECFRVRAVPKLLCRESVIGRVGAFGLGSTPARAGNVASRLLSRFWGQTPREGQRGELVDWMVQEHHALFFRLETLFLAVRLMDRHLAEAEGFPPRPFLLAAVSLLVASKFEEEIYASRRDLVDAGKGGFTEKDLDSAELGFLQRLDFRLHEPTAVHFLASFQACMLRHCGISECSLRGSCRCGACVMRSLSSFLLELGVADEASLTWMPSLHAAGAVHSSAVLLQLPRAASADFGDRWSAKACNEVSKTLHGLLLNNNVGIAIRHKHLLEISEEPIDRARVGDLLVARGEVEMVGGSGGGLSFTPGGGNAGSITTAGSGARFLVEGVLADGSARMRPLVMTGSVLRRCIVHPDQFDRLHIVSYTKLARVVERCGVTLERVRCVP